LCQPEETNLLTSCDQLREKPRELLGSTINVIKNLGDAVAMEAAIVQINSVKKLNAQVSVGKHVYVAELFTENSTDGFQLFLIVFNVKALPDNVLIQGLVNSGDNLETFLHPDEKALEILALAEQQKKERFCFFQVEKVKKKAGRENSTSKAGEEA
jgi:hypothetical protein